MKKKIDSNSATVNIIIGGGALQGKSLVASKISYEFGIPLVIGTDTIRNILHVQNPGITEYFEPAFLLTPSKLEAQKQLISNLLFGLVEHHEKIGESVIIEGSFLSPKFIDQVSKKSNSLMLCLNNTLSSRERIRLKTLTRKKNKFISDNTSKLDHKMFQDNNYDKTLSALHSDRIFEIHNQIVDFFEGNDLAVINFGNLYMAMDKIKRIVRNFISERSGRNQGI